MMRSVALLVLLLLHGGIAPGAAPLAGAQEAPVQRGVVVQPDSVRVGDPFRVVVRIRASRGATITFPPPPDSTTMVEALDPPVVVAGTDTTVVEQTATYRLAAWDVGRLRIRLGDVVVTEGARERRVPFEEDLGVDVVSVLPADSSERVPRPPRPLYEFGPPWWLWLLALLAAIALGTLLWWLWRRRRPAVVPLPDAYTEAQEEFARIEALALVASGERGHHVALMGDVVRTYLARVVAGARTALTTTELLAHLRGERQLPLARLGRLLHDVDLVKFAGRDVGAERAQELGVEARALVDAVHVALASPTLAEAA